MHAGEIPAARFTPQKDAWLVVTLSLLPVAMAFLAVLTAAGEAPIAARAVLIAVLLAAGGFSLWALFGTSYEIRSGYLLVRCGPLRWRLRLETIVEVLPDRNLLSSAALSYDRLLIRRRDGGDDLYISPRDRSAFLDAVHAACPALKRAGDRLVAEAEGRT